MMTTVVRARLAPGRSVDVNTFADLTPSPATVEWGPDGVLVVEFADDLAPAVLWAVRIRLLADGPTEEALRSRLLQLGAQSPTTVADRLLRLERAMAAVIKLEIHDDQIDP